MGLTIPVTRSILSNDLGVAAAPDRAAQPEGVEQPVAGVGGRRRDGDDGGRLEAVVPGGEGGAAVPRDVDPGAGGREERPVPGVVRRGGQAGDARPAPDRVLAGRSAASQTGRRAPPLFSQAFGAGRMT